jgi:hypothetical protein
LENLSSITIGYLASKPGSRKAKHWKRMQILLVSGCGATLINHSLIGKLKTSTDKKTKWTTKAGKFSTNKKCCIHFTLLAFHKHREIMWNYHVDDADPATCNYDLIIGCNLMHKIGMDIWFSTAATTT